MTKFVFSLVFKTNISNASEVLSRNVFSTGAMGALAPATFGYFSTVGKKIRC